MTQSDSSGAVRMATRSRMLFALFVVVLAPIGAVVIVSVLLLFGVHPRVVFAPGWTALSALRSAGLHAPNAVGVITTVGLWWLLFVIVGVAWESRSRRRAS